MCLTIKSFIFKDGDRNIYRSYPNDEWASEEFWPGGYSALTNLGKQQQYELGQYLRERYASLLGRNGEYSPDIVYVRATVVKNTHQNLFVFLFLEIF